MSEIRRDPITGRTVVYVPGRVARPNEHRVAPPGTSAGSDCPFCEGNESRTPPELAATAPPDRRANGRGWQVRTIPNRFPTVTNERGEPSSSEEAGPFFPRAAFGFHEVVIESPDHAPMLPHLPREQVARILRMCRDRVRNLSGLEGVGSVTLFENAGPESGGTLWHPHCQLVATAGLTPSLREEIEGAAQFDRRGEVRCAFEEVVNEEIRDGSRRMFASPEFVAFAPFASAYPYEMRLQPSRHSPSFAKASDAELEWLADRLPALLRALLAVTPNASYNFVVRSPAGTSDIGERYHWHLDVYPRVVRPDGFDLGSGLHVNPVLPEVASGELRAALGTKL